jgi:uncharacterized protein YkwD
MLRKLLLLVCLSIWLALGFPSNPVQARAAPPASTSPSELARQIVAAVNDLRQEEGLATLNAHSTLMQLAQAQADYMAATGQVTHLSADGSRPFQRALAAGYPVAGDLTLGGFYSENIQTGPIVSAKEVIEMWMQDELHQNTMLSEYRSDMGAGVAFVGDTAYYVLDTALASPYRAVITLSASPLPGQSAYVIAPAATSTPLPDGSIVHTVRMGETLWGIAAVYNTSVDQVALNNRISPDRFLHPGDQLLVRQASTATPIMLSIPTSMPRGSTLPNMATRFPGAGQSVQDQPQQGLPLNKLVGVVLLAVAVVGGVWLAVEWKKDSEDTVGK